jgi:predicted nuclease with TOPRIM domain
MEISEAAEEIKKLEAESARIHAEIKKLKAQKNAMTRRLGEVCDHAEAENTDEARLAAYAQLREMLGWLRYPLEQPEVYE